VVPPISLAPYHSGGATASASSVAKLMHPTAGMESLCCNPLSTSAREASSTSSPAILSATLTASTKGWRSPGDTRDISLFCSTIELELQSQ